MEIIETEIKAAFDKYKKSGNLKELVSEVADVADCGVRSQGNAMIMYDAIKKYCPQTSFECVYYDGENGGVYRLLDFDPNGLDKGVLLMAIKHHLSRDRFIDSDYIEKAMETVYLLNSNTLIKVKE